MTDFPITMEDISKRLMERDVFEREMRVMRILLAELILKYHGGEMQVSEGTLIDGAPGLTLEMQREFERGDWITIRAKRRDPNA